MMLRGSIAKAYLVEDRSRFMDEALASYKEMLKREVRDCRYRCRDGLEGKNPLSPTVLERAFKNWLEDTLRADSAVPSPSHMKVPDEIDARLCLKEGIVSPSVSVMTDYGGSRFSFGSSFEQCAEGQLGMEKDIFLEDCYSRNEHFLFPPGYGNGAKSRTGSWSDSGYCCDKSDSDNSRFSSLSFSACLDTEDCPSQDFGEGWKNSRDGPCTEYWRTESGKQSNEHFSGLQDLEIDNYNEEEIKVLQELMKNPENFHETPKELADMARDVSSKRKTSKTLSCIGRFFRNFVKNVRKCSADKIKLKSSGKFQLEDENRGKPQRRLSIRSCPSPFQKRSSSKIENEMLAFSVKKQRKEIMQRANSYSSLFGQKGSLFSHTERNACSRMVKRSESCDIIRQMNFGDARNNFDCCDAEVLCSNVDNECSTDRKLGDLERKLSPRFCLKDGVFHKTESDLDFGRYGSSHDASEFVAPLSVCINKERSAHTRRIRKLSEDIF